jgi:hypothetical protein
VHRPEGIVPQFADFLGAMDRLGAMLASIDSRTAPRTV